MISLLSLPVLVLGFQNCGQVSVTDMGLAKPTELGQPSPETPNTPEGEPGTNPNNPGYQNVRQTCVMARAANRIKTKTLEVKFPNPGRVCDWGANGNFEQENDKLRARREIYKDLELNQGAKVCNVEMKNTDNQDFWYDDNIFLTLNGFVLASTSDFTRHLESQDNLYLYNWARLRNKDGQVSSGDTTIEKQYCAGSGNSLSNDMQSVCSFPITEQKGTVNLNFPDSIIQRILGLTTVESVKLGVITTGDNNETDCQHVDLNFEVTIHYFDDLYISNGL